MSFQSKVLYTGDGEQYQFTITFPFISSSHVSVYINEVLQLEPLNYTRSGSTITFNSIPEQDDAIVIQRWTSPVNTLVDFEDGSTLRADDLDIAYLHNFYLSQEYADSFNELINETLLNIASGAGIVETETDAIIAALVNEMLNTEQAATIQQRVTDIDNNAEAILSLTDSLQTQINTLAQGVAAVVYLDDEPPVPGVPPYPDPIVEGARWYDTNDNNTPYLYQSSAWVSLEDPRIGQASSDIVALQANVENNYAAILAEQFIQATQNYATASSLAVLGAQNADGSAFIIDLDNAKIDTDTGISLASRFSTIDSNVGTNAAAITTEQTARADGDSAIASTIALMGAENGGGTAFILDEDTVKIASDGGDTVAERFTALSAADSANSASITTINTVTIPGINSNIADIEAEYGVDITVNGYVSGFRLVNGGTPGDSAFVILADKFAIVDPSGDPSEPEFIPFQIVGGQVRFNTNVEIDGNLMVSGTINGSAMINGTIGSTQIGANAITTTQLNANAVTAAKIAANAVTATEINVSNLASVSSTTGQLTVDSAGHIKGGQTAYNTGSGFFLGYSSGYKFSIGDGGSNSLTWDGTTLSVVGAITNSNSVGIQPLLTSLTDSSNSTSTYVKKKSFQIGDSGNVRFAGDGKRPNDPGSVPGTRAGFQIKIGAAVKATIEVTTTSFAEYTADFAVTAGDVVDVYIRGADSTFPTSTSPISTRDIEIRTAKYQDQITLDIA
jgi:hypothetical protein